MRTRTIPEDQWIEYFDRFSRDHVGCALTIEVLDKELGPQHLAVDLPLSGISFDTSGTRPSSIEISAGDRPDGTSSFDRPAAALRGRTVQRRCRFADCLATGRSRCCTLGQCTN
jgi:hypothetical protein